MRLTSKVPDAYYAFAMAHKFLKEYDIRWLPVNPYEIIHKTPNWKLKYVPQLAYELNKSEEHVLNHVMRSKDGLAMFDVAKDQYNIILNPSEEISAGRRLWTTVHEIGHIYLNHLSDFKKTSITKDSLSLEEYNHLEFEADMFAGEVLASKWLMRYIDIGDETDITLLTGISDDAARSRYKKATEEYSFVPANIVYTLSRFEDYIKEITYCAPYDWFDLARFTSQNTVQPFLRKPMPPFIKAKNTCKLCGNQHGITEKSNFCIACGKPLKSSVTKAINHCNHVNIKEAAFCEKCGNRVYRIRQGFCREECEL